jgi:hypothetical protein
MAMTAKKRLIDALFADEHREHVNLKFFRGTGNDVSTEQLCEAAASAIFQVNSGIVERRTSFGDRDCRQIEVARLIACA